MRRFLTQLLTIILVILVITEIFYSSITNSITKESIKESIKTNLLTGLIYDNSGNKSEIFKTIMRLTKLDEETTLKLIENETANRYITDIVNSIYDYNLTGDSSYKYKPSEITEIVENNIDKVLDEIDYPISTSDRKEIIDYTKNNGDYIISTIYSTNIGDYVKW